MRPVKSERQTLSFAKFCENEELFERVPWAHKLVVPGGFEVSLPKLHQDNSWHSPHASIELLNAEWLLYLSFKAQTAHISGNIILIFLLNEFQEGCGVLKYKVFICTLKRWEKVTGTPCLFSTQNQITKHEKTTKPNAA